MTRRRALLLAVSLTALTAWLAAGPTAVVGEEVKPGAVAPEIAGGPWINSGPLTTAGLRGRVTLVEFWTYG